MNIENEIKKLPGEPNNPPKPQKGLKSIASIKEEFYSRLLYKGEHDGVLTGVDKIDDSLRGLKGIVTLAGSPKAGKTTMAVQMCVGAHNITKFKGAAVNDRTYILFYSLELNQDAINEKILAHLTEWNAGVTGFDIRFKGRKHLENYAGINGAEGEAPGGLSETQIKGLLEGERKRQSMNRFFIRTAEDGNIKGFETLREDIKMMKEFAAADQAGEPENRYKTRYLVVIDHLQLFKIDPNELTKNKITTTIETENYLIAEFHRLQKETPEMVILLISQLNKTGMREPGNSADSQMSNVKGSVNITYVSGTIITMETKDVYAEDIKIDGFPWDGQKDGTGDKTEDGDKKTRLRKSYARLVAVSAVDRFTAGIDPTAFFLLNPQKQTFHFLATGGTTSSPGERGKYGIIKSDVEELYKGLLPKNEIEKYGVKQDKITKAIEEQRALEEANRKKRSR